MNIQTVIGVIVSLALAIVHVVFTPKLVSHLIAGGKEFEKMIRRLCIMSIAAFVGGAIGSVLFK